MHMYAQMCRFVHTKICLFGNRLATPIQNLACTNRRLQLRNSFSLHALILLVVLWLKTKQS